MNGGRPLLCSSVFRSGERNEISTHGHGGISTIGKEYPYTATNSQIWICRCVVYFKLGVTTPSEGTGMSSARDVFLAIFVSFGFGYGGHVFGQQSSAEKVQPLVEIFRSWDEVENSKLNPEDIESLAANLQAAIEKGANVNASDKFGNTPLLIASYWAAWRGDGHHFNDIVKLLLANGADPNADSDVGTPLHLAAIGKNVGLIEILCAAGASTSSQMAYEGRKVTPLDMARHYNFCPGITSAMKKCASTQ